MTASTEVRKANLRRLFQPRSIAIVGASTSPDKAGYQAVKTLSGFPGTLVPINPKATEILGHKAFPSVTEATRALGAAPDFVILAVPAQGCVAALAEAAACGCGGTMIISGGFGEAGGEGIVLQQQLEAICRGDSGIRVLGPNTSGYLYPPGRTFASFAPGVETLQAGPVAVVAQSGGVNLTLAYLIERQGLGLSLSVGLGNAVDTDAADVLELIAEDDSTTAIALHLEGFDNGRRLYDVLRRITPNKAVVAVVAGRSDIGAFAQSHTGNLIGAWDRKAAMLRQAGVIVVDGTEQVAQAVAVLARGRIPPKARPGIGLLTGQAGPGLLTVDAIKQAGVDVPELAEATVAQIATLLPPLTYMKNPVDTGRPGPTFPQVLQALARDPAIDAVAMFTIYEPAAVDPVAVLSDVKVGKPLVYGTLGLSNLVGPTLAALTGRSIPCAISPEMLALGAVVLAKDAMAQHRMQAGAANKDGEVATAKALQGPLDEQQAKALLAMHGIRVPRSRACASRDEARAAFGAMDRPLVAKILSSEIAHKTEAGGVKLNIRTDGELEAALDALDAIPLKGARRYLLEDMAAPAPELIVGGVRDPVFGPVVVLGLGGTAAEALRDSSVRLAPLTTADALEMIEELRGKALLEGFRGTPATDKGAIAELMVAVSQLMAAHPEIAELDINPVRAYPDRVVALDALVVL